MATNPPNGRSGNGQGPGNGSLALAASMSGVGNSGVDEDSLTRWNDFESIGLPGLRHAGGWLYEEWERQLQGDQGKRTYRMMIDSDPIINAITYTIEMLARQVTWSFNPASESVREDQDASNFAKECILDDMNRSWNSTLSDIMSFVWWGFNPVEMTFKERLGMEPGTGVVDSSGIEVPLPTSQFDDGKIGIAKLEGRAQETVLHWVFWPNGDTRAMVQLPPPDYRRRVLPEPKMLLFQTVNRKGNPESRPAIRGAYEPWYLKRHIQRVEAIGIERDLTGIPVAYIPSLYMKADATPEQQAFYAQMKRIVTTIKADEQAGIVFPLEYDQNGNKRFEIGLMATSGTRAINTTEVVDRLDQRIAASMLADFVLIGAHGAGSLALARTKTNIFAVAMGAFLDHVAEEINQKLIPTLFRLNGWKLQRLPKIAHSRIAAFPLEDIAAFITALAQAGMPLFPSIDGALEKYMLQLGDLPVSQALEQGKPMVQMQAAGKAQNADTAKGDAQQQGSQQGGQQNGHAVTSARAAALA